MNRISVPQGTIYGKLTVVDEIMGDSVRKFLLLCECGNETIVRLGNLRTGHTLSCGCLIIENGKKNKTHGLTSSKVYSCWSAIKTRCCNSNSEAYIDYGGRGINIQENWIDNFENFYDYVGDPPSLGGRWSVERIDCNGHYEEGNVKWALPSTQNRNRRQFRNNTSGTTGVSIRSRNDQVRYVANWFDLDGTQRSKSFSVKEYGEDAMQEAIKFREEQISKLIADGADYSANHGVKGEQINAYDMMSEFGVIY